MSDINKIRHNGTEYGIGPIDTGWIDISLESGVTAEYARLRKIGNVVHINIEELKGYTLNTQCATIPEGFRPESVLRVICATTGKNFARVEINNLGVLQVFNNTSMALRTENGPWVDVLISYVV